jgi:GNAT superfamily N-acetyltransferase
VNENPHNHRVLLSTRELARRVQRAEIDFCAIGASHEAGGRAHTLDAGGGRAVFGRLGSPLNKVLGLGLQGTVRDDDLDAIERFYGGRKAPIAIELCPLAAPDLPARLCARGYVPQSFENELVRQLPATDLPPMPEATAVVVEPASDGDEWLDAVAEGFAASEHAEAPASSETIADTADVMRAFLHPGIVRYLARVDGSIAGGGASYAVGEVLGIFGTATVARFRRRGVQRAMVMWAMANAPREAALAIATTEPGSTSQRTFERLGFQVVYTRTIFVRPAG